MAGGSPSNSSNTTRPTVSPAPPEHDPVKSVGGMDLGCCVEPSSVIWMMLTLFAFTVFLLVLFCILTVATRWIYKRRMKKKCEALRAKYLQEEKQRKMDEIRARRLALRPILPFRPTKPLDVRCERKKTSLDDEKEAISYENLVHPTKLVPYGTMMDDRRTQGLETKSQLVEKHWDKMDENQLERTQMSAIDEIQKTARMTMETTSAVSFLTSSSPYMTLAGSSIPYMVASPFEPNKTRDYLGAEPTRPAPSGFSHLQAVAKKSLLSRNAPETRPVTPSTPFGISNDLHQSSPK